MSTALKNNKSQGLAAVASYGSAALGFEIPSNAKVCAQATFRNTGTAGDWLITFRRSSGPTTTDYSIKLGPGEPWTEENPPIGAVWFLESGANGPLSWYAGWRT